MKEVVMLKASSGLQVNDVLKVPTALAVQMIANGDAKLKDAKDKSLVDLLKVLKPLEVAVDAKKEDCKEGCEDCENCAETTNLPERNG